MLALSWLVLCANGLGILWFIPETEGRGAQGVLVVLAVGFFGLAWVLHRLIRWVFSEAPAESRSS